MPKKFTQHKVALKNQANSKKLVLKEIIAQKIQDFESLFIPLEFDSFSQNITLQEYQIAALKNALVALKLYTQSPNLLYQAYLESGIEDIAKEQINTASFWMATGSGKSIVMLKLITLLQSLMQSKSIESKPCLLLVPNEKILEQFRAHVQDYNAYQSKNITLKDLKEYENPHSQHSLFEDNIVFIGRSDLLENKENVGKDSKAKRLNYESFLREGGFYILLDEAHKGDNKDSVRKGYIRELAEGKKADAKGQEDKIIEGKDRGFIFNFSATFSDSFDLCTCAFNYNLERFHAEGYGKNIIVLDSDLKAFKSTKHNTEQVEKILESFILFCAIKKHKEKIIKEFSAFEKEKHLNYHKPLLIAVADKVNTKDAGIKLYFEAILAILKEERDISPLAQRLYTSLADKTHRIYFDKNMSLDKELLELIKSMDSKTLRQEIFYTKELSMIEACKIKGNTKELVFKAKNAKTPFLLLNIGSIREWEKEYLLELGIESGEDIAQGYFDSINEQTSPIQIMIGSKVFSEGWDSNRVNMISFINIGSKNAKKYVLQTLGRGVRIEPFKAVRKRLGCYEKLNYNLTERFLNTALGIESLFIMATQSEAIKVILEGLEEFIQTQNLSGVRKNKNFKPLLVPKYQECASLQDKPYIISQCDFKELQSYVESFDEDVLLLKSNLKTQDLGFSTLNKIKAKMADWANEEAIIIKGDIQSLEAKNALKILDSFFRERAKELAHFDELKDEICHYQKFSTTLDRAIIEEMNDKIKELLKAKSEEELQKELEKGKIDIKQYTEAIKHNVKTQKIESYELNAELKEHYYSPLILDTKHDGKVIYAIREKSEREFLKDLQEYVKSKHNALKDYEWCFSRIVENVDSIYIPYFDLHTQSYKKFYPDFIFWLRHKQSKAYTILFIDPKGLEYQANAKFKLEAFREIFKESKLHDIKVHLVYYNKSSTYDDVFKDYIAESCQKAFENIAQ